MGIELSLAYPKLGFTEIPVPAEITVLNSGTGKFRQKKSMVWSTELVDGPACGLRAYYNCDSSTIRVRFQRDSSTIRARQATTRYEVFRALAHEIDSSTPRESVVGVSCMLIDSSMNTIFTLYLYRQGRRHGFESGGGQIVRAERAENFFLTPPLFGQWGGAKYCLHR